MPYLLDTNIIAALMRAPHGIVREHITRVGERNVCTNVVVTGELHYGIARKASIRLAAQLDAILSELEVLALEPPVDEIYGRLRADLERKGALIGPNDLLIAAHCLSLGYTLVTDNVREFARVEGLVVENWLR